MPGRSPLPHDPRQLAAALGESTPGAALLARLAASRRIARILASDPELSRCGVDFERPGCCELRDQVLRLSTQSPAETAKLRQSAPAMQKALSKHGFDGIQIKMTVQPCHIDYRNDVSSENLGGTVIDSTDGAFTTPIALRELRAFAEKLAQTITNPTLRASAERMYRAAEARLARMRDEGDA